MMLQDILSLSAQKGNDSMNKFEELLEEAAAQGIVVDETFHFSSNLLGLYIDGNVALSDRLETTTEKACILAEELGHHFTSVGNILDQSLVESRKQELKARLWSYQKLVTLQNLIDAFGHGYRNFHEIAEYLDVTEEVLRGAIEAYRTKYGISVDCGEYYVAFEPYLMVGKKL